MFEQLIAMFSVRCDKQTAERENLDIEFLNFMDKSQIAYIHVRVQKKNHMGEGGGDTFDCGGMRGLFSVILDHVS